MKKDKNNLDKETKLKNIENAVREILTKDSKKSPTSISGRWIAFFVKKLKKGYTYDTIFV